MTITGNGENDPDPWFGRMLAGRYRIVAMIGIGGMGVVYRAWDTVADRYCVVKAPRRELVAKPQFIERFARELAVLQRLVHPAIVPIHDIGEEERTPFAVMPYLAGGSLKRRQRIRQGRPVPAEAASISGWLVAIAGALDFVHARGLVHRDVKPDNILFDGAGRVFLGDFGVAKVVIQADAEDQSMGLTATGIALGTPAYMAPELINGFAASAASDQYALAVLTYELLSGRKPFDGPTPAAIIVAHAAGKPAPLGSLRPDLPSATVAAVMRGMAKSPAQRFDSCGGFAKAVVAMLPTQSEPDKQQLMCPRCGRLLNVLKAWAGKRGSCPKCEGPLAISDDAITLWLPEDRSGPVALVSPLFEVGLLGHTSSDGLELPKTFPQVVWESMPRSFVTQALLAAILLLTLLGGAWWLLWNGHSEGSHSGAQRQPDPAVAESVRQEKEPEAVVADIAQTPPSPRSPVDSKPAEEVPAATQAVEQPAMSGPRPPRSRDELALDRALDWLVGHQCDDGGWSFDFANCPACAGRCSQAGDSSRASDRTAATALALLPLMSRGHSPTGGPHGTPLSEGVAFLAELTRNGQGKAYLEDGSLVSQALAGMVLADAYAMTQDQQLVAPAQMATNYIAASQDPATGGWSLVPTQRGNTTVTAWCLLALANAHRARLTVNPLVIKRAVGFLDSMQTDRGASYGDREPGVEARASAAGLLCRRKCGWKNDNPALQAGVVRILGVGLGSDLEYCFFATQLMHDVGGDAWGLWSNRTQPQLIDLQETTGHEAGSWFDGVAGGRDGRELGRLYTTALAALVLAEGFRAPLVLPE